MSSLKNKNYFKVGPGQQSVSSFKFHETKSLILGTGQTLVLIILASVCLIPASWARTIAKNNIQDINSGNGRLMVYAGRIALVTFVNYVFPFLFFFNNTKMRKTLIREAKTDLKIVASWFSDMSN